MTSRVECVYLVQCGSTVFISIHITSVSDNYYCIESDCYDPRLFVYHYTYSASFQLESYGPAAGVGKSSVGSALVRAARAHSSCKELQLPSPLTLGISHAQAAAHTHAGQELQLPSSLTLCFSHAQAASLLT